MTMTRLLKISCACLTVALMSGCGALTHYTVSVNGYSKQATKARVTKSPVYIQPNASALNQFLDQEVQTKLAVALKARGQDIAESPGLAYYILAYDYGIDDGKNHGFTSYNQYGRPFASSEMVYTRKLTLTLRSRDSAEPVWIGEATSRGSSSDIRKVIDFLTVASIDHFLENTNKEVRHTYYPDME